MSHTDALMGGEVVLSSEVGSVVCTDAAESEHWEYHQQDICCLCELPGVIAKVWRGMKLDEACWNAVRSRRGAMKGNNVVVQ